MSNLKKRKRDKVLSLRLTKEEKILVDYIFNKYNQSNTDTFLEVMKYYYNNELGKEKNIHG